VLTFIALAIMIVMQMGIVAITDGVLKNHKEELQKYEDNKEVLRLDRQAEADAAAFNEATSLATMPLRMKLLLYSAAAACWVAGGLQFGAADDSFADFQVTDDVSEMLCLSCEKALVKVLGWVSIGMMIYGTIALKLFSKAGSARVAQLRGSGGQAAMI